VSAPTLDSVDEALRRWRGRLAAASRNVSELSELPEFLLAKQAAAGTGRLAAEAGGLVATMDELWRGVLLIGAVLDRAEQARKTGSRLWRGEEAAAEAMAILDGPSINVDLADTPVLHRSLLAGARAVAVVSPDGLLQTMQAAFDSARGRLARVSEATARAGAVHRELEAAVAGLPGGWAARLQAAERPDALDRLDALEALRPAIAAAMAVQAGVAAAGQSLAALAARQAEAEAAAVACREAATAALPPLDAGPTAELAAWLDRITQTLASGRTEAAGIGLANWRALHDRAAAQAEALAAAAKAALARRDELRARLGLLRAKRRARGGVDMGGADAGALDTAAERALAAAPMDLDAAAAALRAYQAALAAP